LERPTIVGKLRINARMTHIHPTAIVDPRAQLGDDVQIGPYAIIDGPVTLGDRVQIGAHAVLKGPTRIGNDCKIAPLAAVGLDPQHLKYNGAPTWLIIGHDTVIREYASLHRSMTEGEDHATRIGHHCFIMGGVHVAHDCAIADHVTLAQNAILGGHVTIGERVFVGGGAGIHQFCRVGRLAMISGNHPLSRDIPPFAATRVTGLKGYNAVGCRRAGLSSDVIHAIRTFYHALHTHRTVPSALEYVEKQIPFSPEIGELVAFCRSTKRGIEPSSPHPKVPAEHGDAD
jgi:UDP-N-acetylglucosamine acyltransferase